jgi:hypothetical protein
MRIATRSFATQLYDSSSQPFICQLTRLQDYLESELLMDMEGDYFNRDDPMDDKSEELL